MAQPPSPALEAAWHAAVAKVLKGADFETALTSRADDGFPIRPLYPPAPLPPPILRRPGAARVVQRLHGASSAGAEIEGGADGLVLTLASAATGRGRGLGVIEAALDDAALESMARDGSVLRLEAAPFEGSAAADALLGLCDRLDLDPALLDADLGLDPLGDAARAGALPPGAVARAAAEVPRLRAAGLRGPVLRMDGRPHHEAGGTAAQELAAVLASGIAYLRVLETAGLPLDEARAALSVVLVADTDLLLTVCKLRALRRLWARIEAACGLAPVPVRLHAETAWRTQARRDPHTNLLRTTLAAAGAILGQADGVTILPFTLVRGEPDAEALRLARATGLILREEAHLGRVLDPVAGAGAFEALTRHLCEAAWALFQDIEREGGLGAALASGTSAARLAAAREKRRAAFAEGRAEIVGVTLHPDPAESLPELSPPSGRDAEPFEATP